MVRRLVIVPVLAALLGACTPPSEKELAYLEERRRKEEQRQILRSTIYDGAKDEDVLEMVTKWPAPDGKDTMETWVERQVESVRHLSMFPRWDVLRRGSNRYEVRYTYTHVDGESITKRGFAWNVDYVLKLVSAPRELVVTEVNIRQRASDLTQQQRRRIREHELSLE